MTARVFCQGGPRSLSYFKKAGTPALAHLFRYTTKAADVAADRAFTDDQQPAPGGDEALDRLGLTAACGETLRQGEVLDLGTLKLCSERDLTDMGLRPAHAGRIVAALRPPAPAPGAAAAAAAAATGPGTAGAGRVFFRRGPAVAPG